MKKVAVLLCGGVGSRLEPLSSVFHKSLVPINGEPNIVWTIDWLTQEGVSDIYLVTTTPDEFKYLRDRVSIVHSTYPDEYNNIVSLKTVISSISDDTDGLFIVEGDQYLKNPYELWSVIDNISPDRSYYIAKRAAYKSSEWILRVDDTDRIIHVDKNSYDGYRMSGMSYWTGTDLRLLIEDIKLSSDYSLFWEDVFIDKLSSYNIYRVIVNDDTLVEYDTILDLVSSGLISEKVICRYLSGSGVVKKLSSMTNSNYLVKDYLSTGADVVIRYPGGNTDSFIDRSREIRMNKIFDSMRITPRINMFGAIKITEYVPNSSRLTLTDDKDKNHAVLSEAVNLIRRIHKLDYTTSYPNDLIDLYLELDLYARVADEVGAYYDRSLYDKVRSSIRSVQHKSLSYVHRDLVPENFLFSLNNDFKAMVIDFEYSGILDKYWDLGSLITELCNYYSLDSYSSLALRLKVSELYGGSINKIVLWESIVNYVWYMWTLAQPGYLQDSSLISYGSMRLDKVNVKLLSDELECIRRSCE